MKDCDRWTDDFHKILVRSKELADEHEHRNIDVAHLHAACREFLINDGFRTGDTVRLRSGGPDMTVNGRCGPYGEVECDWFDKDGMPHDGYFHPETLDKVP